MKKNRIRPLKGQSFYCIKVALGILKICEDNPNISKF